MTLLMRDQENIEKGIEKGRIYGAVSVCRDFGMEDREIVIKLQEKYNLSEKEAREYLEESV